MEQCRLCKCTDKPLKESHIIPKMFYNELKRNSPTHIMRMADNPNRGVQDGLKLPFLCGECEELFSKYERAFSKNDEKATVILSVASFEYSIGS